MGVTKPGKDVWLRGGVSIFHTFVELEFLDPVEVGVMPVLLREGIPQLPGPVNRVTLKLTGHKIDAQTAIMSF
jgi:dihydrofolate reductase